jgi:uncharacterized membrane protein YbhN (UPF0104 family)
LTPAGVAAAILVGAALAMGALAGVSWVAGFGRVFDRFDAADWAWLPVAVGCVVASHVGYTFAYREVLRCQGGPVVPVGIVGASVLAGFGMLIPRAGFTMDRGVMKVHGLSEEQARGSVMTLGMLEYAILAPATLVASIVLILEHFPSQGGVLVSWVIGVPAGTAITLALIANRNRLPEAGWFWRIVHEVLDAVASLREFAASPVGLLAVLGMAVYWTADIAALGACFEVVRHVVPVSVLIVGYSTGYAMTRRSLPFAGAGAAEALMPFAMHWLSVPLAAAVLAVFAYRLCNLWLPLGPSVFALRHLRKHTLLPAT